MLNTCFREFFATYIEKSIPDFLEDLGKHNTTNSVAEILDTAVEDFENAKRRFTGWSDATEGKEMSIHIPGIRGNPGKRVLPGRILVPRYAGRPSSTATTRFLTSNSVHIRDLFQKIIVPIIGMIQQQIKAFNEKYHATPERRIKVCLRPLYKVHSSKLSQRIVFVGGLSSSQYVWDTLNEVFCTGDSPLMGYPITIMTPYENS